MYKHTLLKLVTIISISFSINTYATELQDFIEKPADETLKSLKQLDCSINQLECQYVAAVDTAAFLESCKPVLTKRMPHASDEGWPDINKILVNWKSLTNADIRNAVLIPNKFHLFMTEAVTKYLSSIPLEEVGIECYRVKAVMDQVEAEDMSDLIPITKNYRLWRQKRPNATF